MKSYLFLTLLCLPTVNVTLAQIKSDSAALYSQFERQAEAYQQENANILAKLYTKNALMLPPGRPPIAGREAIYDLFAKQFSSGMNANVDFNTIEVWIADDRAYRRGTYTIILKTPKGKNIQITDKFIDIWKKSDDSVWRITRDIWNHNVPMPVIRKKAKKVQKQDDK